MWGLEHDLSGGSEGIVIREEDQAVFMAVDVDAGNDEQDGIREVVAEIPNCGLPTSGLELSEESEWRDDANGILKESYLKEGRREIYIFSKRWIHHISRAHSGTDKTRISDH